MTSFRKSDLEAYLDEALPADEMATVERAARDDSALLRELASIAARRDAGFHSLGSVWRRKRVTCPTRGQWGSYLMGILPPEEAEYLQFHLELVACRLCNANVADLRAQQAEEGETVTRRRRKYFQSSAGYLRPAR